MSNTTVLVETADRVRTLTLNRPDRLNAWTRDMHAELKEAMHEAGNDPEVRAIILTGAGRGFCAGADMGGLQAIGASGAVSDRATRAEPIPS
ncbi:MAG: enoyl-CoA hydratase/isomerase family protein, partial [Alphaproteobacteria bacterium]|nr:enoyl-CoA hydratase/isomerase family protein [Alphaproteobacteria bacterium]